MISFPANTDIFICHESVSFRSGLDGMIRFCELLLKKQALSGSYFLFINKRKEQIRVLWYDGQGFNLCTKRSSSGKFLNWPKNAEEVSSLVSCFDAGIIFAGGSPDGKSIKKIWKKIN